MDEDQNGVLTEPEFRQVSHASRAMFEQSSSVVLMKYLASDLCPVMPKQLVKSMDALKTENDIQALLEVVDPYNNQQITFSQVTPPQPGPS